MSREYLVAGILQFYGQLEQKVFTAIVPLRQDEVMDAARIAQVEQEALRAQNKNGTIATACMVTSFQMLEMKWRFSFETPAADEIHLNECDVILPPVDSPLLIELAPDILLPATREAHAEKREDLLVFNLDSGGWYTGRPRWTHA